MIDLEAGAAKNRQLLETALAGNRGDRGWRGWKEAEAREVVDSVANRASRLELLELSLEGDFDLVYRIDMPVPCRPAGNVLTVRRGAIFHLKYMQDWRTSSPPGWLPLGIFEPRDIFHPNMRPSLRGAICLGVLPPNVPAREIMINGYHAVQLQNLVLDPRDPHGVLNPDACEFFREHQEHLPLSDAGLFEPWDNDESADGKENDPS